MSLDFSSPWLAILVGFGAIALLYASVGHAGATGYLAIMAIAGFAPAVMRPTALILNLVVGAIVTVRFSAARQIDLRRLVPLIVASIPAAALGASMTLPALAYRPLVAVILLVAAARLAGLLQPRSNEQSGDRSIERRLPIIGALMIGAVLGLLAGLTGTGGGVFLTPVLILGGWAAPRRAAGLSGAFILANSAAGVVAAPMALASLPPQLPVALPIVAIGGAVGAELGARRLPTQGIRRLLALVLLVAATKLLLAP